MVRLATIWILATVAVLATNRSKPIASFDSSHVLEMYEWPSDVPEDTQCDSAVLNGKQEFIYLGDDHIIGISDVSCIDAYRQTHPGQVILKSYI